MQVDPELILEAAPDAVLIVSADGVIGAVNAEAERMFGYSRQEIVGKLLECLVPQHLRMAHAGHRRAFTADAHKRRMGRVMDIVALRRDGSEFPVDISLSPTPVGDVIAIIRDMSDRLRMENDLRKLAAEQELQKNTLESILNSMSDGVIVSDQDGVLLLVNAAAAHLLPQAARMDLRPEAWPAEFGLFMPDQTTPYPPDQLPTARVRRGETVHAAEVFVRHANAQEGIWVSVNGRPLQDGAGNQMGGVIVIRDVTSEKFAESALLTGQETERKRISRELHDSVAQTLNALILEAEIIKHDLPRTEVTVRGLLESHAERLKQLDEEINRIARQLHPSVLERFGLAAAIEQLCREFCERRELRIDFSASDVPAEIARAAELCVYRVAQEALRNVSRHAQTGEATVVVRGARGQVFLSVADRGPGFDAKAVAGKARLGLVNMRERVRIAGGKLTIHSQPGSGTRIEIEVPAQRASLAQAQ